MQYDATLPTDGHDATWLENFGEKGALNFLCEVNDSAVVVSAGWGNIRYCPSCGREVDLETEEQ